jgi:hypothetical protein|tara:strand:+ start:187 stop:456 length:270 start_codon:yes stop_codon:yes gene_type:complete
MFIQIDDKYALTSDSNQWKVQIKREPHPSSIVKSEWVTLSFHHTFKSATESLARRKVRLSGAQNLEDAIKDAQKVGEELSAIFDKSFEK